MDTYRLASAIAVSSDNPKLAAHVAILRRHLGRTSGRKKKKEGTGGKGERTCSSSPGPSVESG